MTEHHGKLHHMTPGWVEGGARFHIRLRLEGRRRPLTTDVVARCLMESVVFYHRRCRWHAWLFMVMPDHLHAVFSLPRELSMSRVIGDWKKYQKRVLDVAWQEGYFDHRLRNQEEFVEKCHYIRLNPVRVGLCAQPADWPWVVEPWKLNEDSH